jgi:hypothetical protein
MFATPLPSRAPVLRSMSATRRLLVSHDATIAREPSALTLTPSEKTLPSINTGEPTRSPAAETTETRAFHVLVAESNTRSTTREEPDDPLK